MHFASLSYGRFTTELSIASDMHGEQDEKLHTRSRNNESTNGRQRNCEVFQREPERALVQGVSANNRRRSPSAGVERGQSRDLKQPARDGNRLWRLRSVE